MKLLFTILFFCIVFTSKAQNLVPNPSFETYSICPYADNLIHLANPWFNPTQGTPDYFNACYLNGSWNVDVPANWIGYQNAKTGTAYAGIAIYPAQNPPSYREYIEVKLIDTLQAGTKYYVSFYVSLADSVSYVTDAIGAYLSSDSVFSNNMINLPHSPQIANLAGNIIIDKQNWTQVSGNFIAQGGEKFIIIGNFKNDPNTDTVFVGGGNPLNLTLIYYYIDDIYVGTDSLFDVEMYNIKNTINIYPNPAIDLININIPENENAVLRIYDITGQLLDERKLIFSQNLILLNTFNYGIYILNIQISNQIFVNKLIISN